MRNKELTVKNVKGIVRINEDSVGKNKNGNIVVRRGFFYTNGRTEGMFAKEVSEKLTDAGITHKIIGKGRHWVAFRGGASLRNQSHWWVEIAR